MKKMKKKSVLWIILIAAAVLIAAAAVWGKQYYENRYVGSDYYAMIPLDYDMTPENLYTMKGEVAGLGKEFKLTAYNEQGEAKSVRFNVKGGDSSKYPQPGSYLFIRASKQLVVRWNVIEENAVPEKAMEKIGAH